MGKWGDATLRRSTPPGFPTSAMRSSTPDICGLRALRPATETATDFVARPSPDRPVAGIAAIAWLRGKARRAEVAAVAGRVLGHIASERFAPIGAVRIGREEDDRHRRKRYRRRGAIATSAARTLANFLPTTTDGEWQLV